MLPCLLIKRTKTEPIPTNMRNKIHELVSSHRILLIFSLLLASVIIGFMDKFIPGLAIALVFPAILMILSLAGLFTFSVLKFSKDLDARQELRVELTAVREAQRLNISEDDFLRTQRNVFSYLVTRQGTDTNTLLLGVILPESVENLSPEQRMDVITTAGMFGEYGYGITKTNCWWTISQSSEVRRQHKKFHRTLVKVSHNAVSSVQSS
jgi:hypothetical protein